MKTKMVVALGGAKGVGKTTLINIIRQRIPLIRVFNYGLILKRLAKSYYSLPFERLPVEIKNELRQDGADYILDRLKSINLIDLHFGEFEVGGYPCVLPEKLFSQCTHIVLVTGSFEKIKERRMKDFKTRRKDEGSIRLNMLGEKLLFKQLTKKRKLKRAVINNDGEVKVAIDELLRFLEIKS